VTEAATFASESDALRTVLDRLGSKLGAEAAYGTPVEKGSVTVIPIASVRWVGGLGSGRSPETDGQDAGSGSGGGGLLSVSPLGYIELIDGGAQFKAIEAPPSFPGIAVLVLASSIGAGILLRALTRLVRG
jgi:uncharacterized spore protein YtfJ